MAKATPSPRRPKNFSDFDDPVGEMSKADRRRLDEEQSRPYRDAYQAGQRSARQQARRPSARPRPAPSRRRVPGARSAKPPARQLAAPVRSQVTGGLRILGLTLAVIALYNVLSSAQYFTGVIGGAQRGLKWLSTPAPVPKRS